MTHQQPDSDQSGAHAVRLNMLPLWRDDAPVGALERAEPGEPGQSIHLRSGAVEVQLELEAPGLHRGTVPWAEVPPLSREAMDEVGQVFDAFVDGAMDQDDLLRWAIETVDDTDKLPGFVPFEVMQLERLADDGAHTVAAANWPKALRTSMDYLNLAVMGGHMVVHGGESRHLRLEVWLANGAAWYDHCGKFHGDDYWVMAVHVRASAKTRNALAQMTRTARAHLAKEESS